MKINLQHENFIVQNGESYVRLSALYKSALYPVVMAPFFGKLLPVILRELNQVELKSCGDFSLITRPVKKINKQTERPLTEIADYLSIQHKIVKLSLVSPTYKELLKLVEKDEIINRAEKEYNEISEIVYVMDEGKEKEELFQKLALCKCQYLSFLPDDFIVYVMSYALSLNKSDIKKVTEDMLYTAAILATKGHDNPANHLEGIFTPFNKDDINAQAWIIYNEKLEELKAKNK